MSNTPSIHIQTSTEIHTSTPTRPALTRTTTLSFLEPAPEEKRSTSRKSPSPPRGKSPAPPDMVEKHKASGRQLSFDKRTDSFKGDSADTGPKVLSRDGEGAKSEKENGAGRTGMTNRRDDTALASTRNET